ncbi:HAD family hydrolase [Clostridium taeniosporum]|uniref:HAD family hydrolase n=1 Tax=Clostridium taeniosporum TaxID=394958 RepID=A0A1D7XNW9_9CLOT|nr:HAD family hydrolase [Clostridium taeniosporum]AOR25004.1 HAD family hydrolase [Clostridium taeniosporum]
MYKCILFDIDGTIIDTEKAVINSLQKLLKLEKGTTYPADELSFALGIPGFVALEKLNILDIDNATKKWNEYLKEFYSDIKVFNGLKEVIEKLYESNVKMGIVTSKTKQELIDDFYPFGLNNYFDYIVCADDTVQHKPEAEPILKCLELTKTIPSETIYIGDSIYDMQCAKNAGIDCALALWGAKNQDLNATIKLNNPKEILNIIKI